MTDTTVAVIVGAVPLTIAAFANLVVSMRASAKLSENTQATKEAATAVQATAAKTDKVLESTTEIKVATDGHLSKLTAEAQVANEIRTGQEREIADLRKLVESLVSDKQAGAEQLKRAQDLGDATKT